MPARGDVLTLRRGIGFGTKEQLERFVVMQADPLNDALETFLAVPLIDAHLSPPNFPLALPVSASEAGAARAQAAMVTQLSCVPWARFDPAPSGRLTPPTLTKLDRALRLALDLT